MAGNMHRRCGWVGDEEIYLDYHDREWGVPLYDDKALFELLILEGAQAGLSWITVLRKRENYRRVFDKFEPEIIAGYGPEKVAELMSDSGIVRNRAKIAATIGNARAWLDIMAEVQSFTVSGSNLSPGGSPLVAGGAFSNLIWSFVDGAPIVNRWRSHAEVPVETDKSKALSRELKKRGFRFVGPTICYAFMQAAGLVNDHTLDCFRHDQVLSDAGTL
jgi:DNA-3-methyladenine glycosylase I